MSEPFVISRLCRDCVDGACIEACPVDCIYEERTNGEGRTLPDQLFINPEECICCSACEPVCPVDAIFDVTSIPAAFEEDIALNATTVEQPDRFDVAVPRLRIQSSMKGTA